MKIECSICFENIGEDDRQVCVTRCGHLFHSDCVKTWMKHSKKASCPQCRHSLRATDLRTVFLNNVSDRPNQDIAISSLAESMRAYKYNLGITQFQFKIKHLESELETLKYQMQKWKYKAESVTLMYARLKIRMKDSEYREKVANINGNLWMLEAKQNSEKIDRLEKDREASLSASEHSIVGSFGSSRFPSSYIPRESLFEYPSIFAPNYFPYLTPSFSSTYLSTLPPNDSLITPAPAIDSIRTTSIELTSATPFDLNNKATNTDFSHGPIRPTAVKASSTQLAMQCSRTFDF